jgi:hypothetical protein
MGLYNFKLQFVRMILDGSKPHTIRTPRRYPDRPGSPMHLYHGCRVLKPAVRLGTFDCESVKPIVLDLAAGLVEVAGVKLCADECSALAWRDGFRPAGSTLAKPGDSFSLMRGFWTASKTLRLEGSLNSWRYAPERVGEWAPIQGLLGLPPVFDFASWRSMMRVGEAATR